MCYSSVSEFKKEYPAFKKYDDKFLLGCAIKFLYGNIEIGVHQIQNTGLKMLANIHWAYQVSVFKESIEREYGKLH